ncbi:MAG: hypothetical protein JKY14_07750, partial [Paraglaciecola sp.]|nr:hypothetical protein [Paraglaciecola sp.]
QSYVIASDSENITQIACGGDETLCFVSNGELNADGTLFHTHNETIEMIACNDNYICLIIDGGLFIEGLEGRPTGFEQTENDSWSGPVQKVACSTRHISIIVDGKLWVYGSGKYNRLGLLDAPEFVSLVCDYSDDIKKKLLNNSDVRKRLINLRPYSTYQSAA